jgi:ATP-binding cassette subfamily B protein
MTLLIWYGGSAAHAGAIQVGVLVAFSTYLLSLFQPVREIADKWSVFLSGMTAAERVFGILDWKPEIGDGETSGEPRALAGVQGRITFENVWFAYEEERWILRDISLEIAPGSRVGIVGHTGAGKTTIISLLLRFYEPQRGRILLDGRDIRELDRRSLRAAIGIIQQDVFLFSGSIADNISLWRESAPEAGPAVRAALQQMGFARWLEPATAANELQERGANLSMGERQVLAYARALSARPSIWILDEATANVDSHTEEKLGASLAAAAGGRTSILIAHRLASVRSADQILVMHKGVLVENGDHRALMAKDGLYARLYRYQSAGGE